MKRCEWASGDPLLIEYHDREWGVPLHDENKHFEFLLLECFQAGLSWLTVLKKRENFRRAFAGFDPVKVARFNEKTIVRLLGDTGIIRNRKKIEAAVHNAAAFLTVQKEYGSFDAYIWNFVGGKPVKNGFRRIGEVPASSPLSDQISRDLKKRGFSFVGTTTIYAHLQAIGIVNDHIISCFRYGQL
jgi:DNA-3-methyladenine glycosylase I